MEAPSIARGKDYVGPRGVSMPARLLSPTERDQKQRRGKVSLTQEVQRPEALEALERVDLDPAVVLPSPVIGWIKVARVAHRDWDCWRQVVKPVNRRSRRSQVPHTVYWMRVWGQQGMILRSWASPGGPVWATGATGLYVPWRGRMIPKRKISVKEATQMIRGEASV